MTSGTAFRVAALVTFFVVVIAAAAETVVDSEKSPSIWDGIWWAVVTVTTVGYSDIAPHSTGGKIIAVFVMLFGIGFLSILTATIASTSSRSERREETEAILAALTRLESEVSELRQRLE